jgi:hypothetical protein
VHEIRRKLNKFFKEIEITDKSNQLEKTDDKFGYKKLAFTVGFEITAKRITRSR